MKNIIRKSSIIIKSSIMIKRHDYKEVDIRSSFHNVRREQLIGKASQLGESPDWHVGRRRDRAPRPHCILRCAWLEVEAGQVA